MSITKKAVVQPPKNAQSVKTEQRAHPKAQHEAAKPSGISRSGA